MKQLLILFLLIYGQAMAQEVCPVIPLPAGYQKANGHFRLQDRITITVKDSSLRGLAVYLQQELQRRYHISARISSGSSRPLIALQLLRTFRAEPEAYSLQMSAGTVTISSGDDHGVFNGIVSLLQLAAQAPAVNKVRLVDCWNITDKPLNSWRGLLLDESRHFFGKEKVKEILDWMAFYKLNRFHWHLTDVPGWRLEIKQYPLLTTKGAIGDFSDQAAPARYYTQDDVREIVSYARQRYITIIPEIDMPGHAAAANRAYPEYSGGGTEKYPDFTFNPGREGTYSYLTNILRETAALFPGTYIHLGGDEVNFGNAAWDRDSAVQRLMRAQQLKDRVAVEHYFLKRMADSIIRLGRLPAAWDETVDAGIDKKTLIFWWWHNKPERLEKAQKEHYNVVLCPRLPMYFDFVQDSTHKTGRRWSGAFNSLEEVYRFAPDRQPYKPAEGSTIIGIQACLWTETVSNARRLDYLLFPRICALAESAWTPSDHKDYTQFTIRLKQQLPLFDKAGIYYYDPFAPAKHPEAGNTRKVNENGFIM